MRLSAEEIESLGASHIVISPGPGRPADAGVCEDVDARAWRAVSPSWACALDTRPSVRPSAQRSLTQNSSCTVKPAWCTSQTAAPSSGAFRPSSGRPVIIRCLQNGIPFPTRLLVIAEDDDGEVMGVKHANAELYGLQFHPESVLTPDGRKIISKLFKTGRAANMIKQAIYDPDQRERPFPWRPPNRSCCRSWKAGPLPRRSPPF